MRITDLQVTNVNITEEEYSYRGLFSLSGEGTMLSLDLEDLEDIKRLEEIKNTFQLEESVQEIKKHLTNEVIEKSSLGSVISEGENYNEETERKSVEKAAKSLDMA